MPLPLTVSCFSKIQIGFTFLVPAHLDSPGQRAVKRVCELLGHIACTECKDAASCYKSWHGPSMCLSVGHNCEPCKNGWTDPDTVWVVVCDETKEPCIKWRGMDPPGEGVLFGGARCDAAFHPDSLTTCYGCHNIHIEWLYGKQQHRCVNLGCDCLPWLGNLNKLGPAAEFSVPPFGEDAQSGQSPFPVAPADKRSYAQNCVVWTKNAGLQVTRSFVINGFLY